MDFFEVISEERIGVNPLLKWTGSKYKLLPVIIPKYINKNMLDDGQTYFEPFMGSGAVAFGCNFKNMVLNDKNKKLVNFYSQTRDNTHNLYTEIDTVIKDYKRSDNKEIYYYNRRKEFNTTTKEIRSAALFWFLNKTGFNGIYREDSKGNLNTPYGKRDCNLSNIKDFEVIADILSGCQLFNKDFEEICNMTSGGDLVYFDPPYIPISETSSFSTYLKGGFSIDDHIRLNNIMEELDKRGVKIVMSNSKCKLTQDTYKNFKIKDINVRRLISAKNKGRGIVQEVVVTNF